MSGHQTVCSSNNWSIIYQSCFFVWIRTESEPHSDVPSLQVALLSSHHLNSVFSHRYFSPPASRTRTHWPPAAPWPVLTPPSPSEGEEPAPDPCSSPPNSAPSRLRRPGGPGSSSPLTRSGPAPLGLKHRAHPASRSRRALLQLDVFRRHRSHDFSCKWILTQFNLED